VVRGTRHERWMDSVPFRNLRMAVVPGAAVWGTLSLAVALRLVISGTVTGLLHAPAQPQTGSLPVYGLQIGAVFLLMAFDLAACLGDASPFQLPRVGRCALLLDSA
jgi:hypothetical protein